jgi:hypothetical protein
MRGGGICNLTCVWDVRAERWFEREGADELFALVEDALRRG